MHGKSRFLKTLFLGYVFTLFPLVSHATIPVAAIKGVDELFKAEYKIYSPLTGLLQHETFISRAFPDSPATEIKEPLEKLLSILFIKISAKEIVPSHIGKNPAAHLSASAIAKIFIGLENRLHETIVSDQDYLSSLERTQKNADDAQGKFDEFMKRFEADKAEAEVAKAYKLKFYDPITIQIKKLLADARKANKGNRPKGKPTEEQIKAMRIKEEPSAEIKALEAERLEVLKKFDAMMAPVTARGGVSNSVKGKVEYDLKHALEVNDVKSDVYQGHLSDFVKTLSACFVAYDLAPVGVRSGKPIPSYECTSSLLSFMWTKYTDKKDLRGYLEAYSLSNGLDQALWSKVDDKFYEDSYTRGDYLRLMTSFSDVWFRKQKWVREHLTGAIAISSDFSGSSKLPQHVPFSYSSWARYHLSFPDCAENVLHNIFLLIAYNEETEGYDYRILQTLKDQHYPQLSQKLIDYFKLYPTAAANNLDQAKRDWIEVVSGLNQDPTAAEDQIIVYSSGKQMTEVAGYYENLLRVVNNLFGMKEMTEDRMATLFSQAQLASDQVNQKHTQYHVVYSNIKDQDGKVSKTANFGVGKRRFQLHSYGAHVTFNLLPSNSDQISGKITKIFWKKAHGKRPDVAKAFRYQAALDFLVRSQAQAQAQD
jgi:hypothetical protein